VRNAAGEKPAHLAGFAVQYQAVEVLFSIQIEQLTGDVFFARPENLANAGFRKSFFHQLRLDRLHPGFLFLDLLLQKDPPPYNNKEKKDGGILVLQKIKEIDPEVEVCIVTGYATEKTHTNAISYGAMDYLQKPFIMEDIYELVNRALRKRREKKTVRKDQGPIGPIH